MKGIILAGGSGTRLYPATFVTSKQLLPIYDKPMIYYPLSVLMQANIREIMIISSPHDLPRFQSLFGIGKSLGLNLTYAIQKEPRGIAEAFIIAESFIGCDSCALILGDNIFYGPTLTQTLTKASELTHGGLIFGYEVPDPCRYGVIAFDEAGKVADIIEKPRHPPSNHCVTGLYFYDANVIEIAKSLQPSLRGELEITDVNRAYLERGALSVELLDRGCAWLDTGTFEALHKASTFVQSVQERQGIKLGCIEEIAFDKGWIDERALGHLATKQSSSEYGRYLTKIGQPCASHSAASFS